MAANLRGMTLHPLYRIVVVQKRRNEVIDRENVIGLYLAHLSVCTF